MQTFVTNIGNIRVVERRKQGDRKPLLAFQLIKKAAISGKEKQSRAL